MGPQRSPKEVLEIASTLTGRKVTGVVEILPPGATEEVYKIPMIEEVLVCIRGKDGWMASLFGPDNKLKTIWSEFPGNEQAARSAASVIVAVLGNEGLEVHPSFVREENQVASGVQRKTFSTETGNVVVHSRRVPKGNETVLEIVSSKTFLRFTWDRKTSVLTPVGRANSLPF